MADEEEEEILLSQLPPMARDIVRKSGIKLTKENFPDMDHPRSFNVLPILLYVVCIILIIIGFLILR